MSLHKMVAENLFIPSSTFQSASPVIHLLQHTSAWASYSAPLYLNYSY